MKKLVVLVVSTLLLLMMPQATAANSVIRITAPLHQTFTGEFRNDDLAQLLTPSGDLGLKVFQPIAKNRTWVIDAALVDEVILMANEYTLATEAEPAGKEIASMWLTQLKRVTAGNDVVALAYGNPDVALAAFSSQRIEVLLRIRTESFAACSWSHCSKRAWGSVERRKIRVKQPFAQEL